MSISARNRSALADREQTTETGTVIKFPIGDRADPTVPDARRS